MPFNYAEYQTKTSQMSTDQLQKEWENYTRQIAGGATSTATSVLFSPLTAGISLMGLGLSAPRIHNARKKREIIEKGLQERGSTHNTRGRDVAGSIALSGAISFATLGLAGPLADAAAGEAVGKGAEYAVAHLALDGVGEAIEHKHGGHLKNKAEQELKMKAMQAQLANLAIQNGGQQQQMMMNNGQVVTGQWVQINGQMIWQQTPVVGGFQQPALTTGMALPNGGSTIQNVQQIQWQQANPSMQLPTMQQPQMQMQTPGIIPDQNGQFVTVGQQSSSSQQRYIPAPPQYQPNPQLQPQDQKTQLNVIPNTMSQQQPDSKYHLNVIDQQPQMTAAGFLSEKSAAYTSQYSDGTMTPLPVYSQQPQGQEQPPNHIDLPPQLSMEEEIAMLRLKLLQLEMEKRGMSATISGPLEISLDPPKREEPQQEQEKTRSPLVQEVAPTQQPLAQVLEQKVAEQPTLLPAPLLSTERTVTPAPVQNIAAPSIEAQQYSQIPQSTTPAPYTQQVVPQHQPAPLPIQTQSTQNLLLPQSASIGRAPSPAPPIQYAPSPIMQQTTTSYAPVQSYTPAPPQQVSTPALIQSYASPQQTPLYQPRPVNAVIQPQQQVLPPQQYVQQNYQPHCPPAQVQRHDSGYYSQAASPMQRPVSSISSVASPIGRHPSISQTPQFAPPPAQAQQYNQYNPAGYNLNHGRTSSIASMKSMASAPPPAYFPPPPGQQPMLAGKTGGDYFGQVPQIGFYQQPGLQQWRQQPSQVVGGEINYGPPPPIPNRM